MDERRIRQPTASQLWETTRPQVDKSGDKFFTRFNSMLIVSPTGETLIRSGARVLPLVNGNRSFALRRRTRITQEYSTVTKEKIRGQGRPMDIAVKVISSSIRGLEMSAIAQFQALRALESVGVPCVRPLVASENTLITEWINLPEISYKLNKEMFGTYLVALNQRVDSLKAEGKLGKDWRIDKATPNYRVGDLSAEDPIQWFVAIDPLTAYIINFAW